MSTYLTYQTLAKIANAYSPTLLAIFVVRLLYLATKRRHKTLLINLAGLAITLLVVYGLMFLDKRNGLWPLLNLDYSTHTAAALGMVILLCWNLKKHTIYFVLSLLAYGALMMYQHYHSLEDILSTAVVVGPLIGGAVFVLNRKTQSTSK
jgi:hypothetical protein